MLANPQPQEYLEMALDALRNGSDRQTVLDGLADQAARCRRLARSTHDQGASEILVNMARGYDATAALLKAE